MPLEMIVHAKDCPLKKRPCTCDPQAFTDSDKAIAAHGGDASRMEFGRFVPPPSNWLPGPIPANQSQTRRHKQEISN